MWKNWMNIQAKNFEKKKTADDWPFTSPNVHTQKWNQVFKYMILNCDAIERFFTETEHVYKIP